MNVREVVGERGLEAHVEVGRHHDRRRDHHGADGALERGPARRRADALGQRGGRRARARAARPPSRRRRRAATATIRAELPCSRRPRSRRRGSARRRARRGSRARRRPRGPTRSPCRAERGPKRASRESGASSRSPTRRHEQREPEREQHDDRQRARGAVGDARRRRPPRRAPTIVIVKVIASPSTIPSGRRRPPVAPAESSAGSTGSTHGLIAVPAPAITANTISSSIGPIVKVANCGGIKWPSIPPGPLPSGWRPNTFHPAADCPAQRPTPDSQREKAENLSWP